MPVVDLLIWLSSNFTRYLYSLVLVVALGLVYAVAYYFVFKYVIERFDVKTPGRSNDDVLEDQDEEMTENELGKLILQGLGGAGNIQEIDNCISRLRLVLKDTATIDEHILKRPAQWESLKLTKIIYKWYMEDKWKTQLDL